MTPVFLTIAGSDSSAGAGIQADIKTGIALGCYPLTAVTCVVSEAPGCVAGIAPMEPEFVASQVRVCLGKYPVAAVKTGMLYSPEIVRAVAAALPSGIPLVVDPVMIATAGAELMQQRALAAYEQALFPRATLITPNRDELQRLTDSPRIDSAEALCTAAAALAARLGCAVLAKGGHLSGDTCADVLARPGCPAICREHPRTPGIPTHGTGCTLSAAITAFLARGLALESAVDEALLYTARAIALSHSWHTTFALKHEHPHHSDASEKSPNAHRPIFD